MKRALVVIAVAVGCVLAANPAEADPAVDADRYRAEGGDYAFQYRYDAADRQCRISDNPTTVRCDVSPPAGTRITVNKRGVRPNAIEVTERGWRYIERRGGRVHGRPLPEGARISVNGASCTAIRDGGIECSVDRAGFTQAGGRFATRGPAAR
ncbi:hypothetical protein [Tsukamurella sp. 1534]|uniref:hypothetical protein n=1 Tax=Tsukamurella sp. 1534 TaxID=1151061 RepID=UPI0005930001|nr:hypothetical protein [Tsukamurella sp. 1534]